MLGLSPVAALPLAAALTETVNRILVSPGIYALTGQTVALRAARMIAPATGSYAITGQANDFHLGLSPAVLGRLILVGSTATTVFGFKMIQNFEMVAGDTKTLVITVKDANDDPVNISSATIKWQAARSFGKASSITKSTSSGITITDGPNGVFTVTLNASDTDSLVGNFIHEAEVTLSSTISTVLQGTMKINKPVIEAT